MGPRRVQAVRGPEKGEDDGGPVPGWGPGPRRWTEGPPPPKPAGTSPPRPPSPHQTRLHDLGRGFWQRRRVFRSSLPGWDFLSIVDRHPAADLVGRSHGRVSLADQALCSSKGHHGGRSSSLSCFCYPREASV